MSPTPRHDRRTRRTRRAGGAVMTWLAMAMVPTIGFLGLSMHWAQVTLAKSALQDYVDARAEAALKDQFGGFTEPIDIGAFLPGQTVQAPDALCGGWDHDTSSFDPGPCPDADGVPAFRVEHSVTVPLLFGGFMSALGASPDVELSASATAFIPRREVVLVQDVSGSLGPQADQARDALAAVVDTMADQDLPGDGVGLVSFGGAAEVESEVVPLDPDAGDVLDEIEDLTFGGGTCTSEGILLGRSLLEPLGASHEVQPLMIVVTDGNPSPSICGGQSAADAAADAACAAGIDIFAVPIGNGIDQANVVQLVCGETEDRVIAVVSASGVADAINEILTQQPVRLVE